MKSVIFFALLASNTLAFAPGKSGGRPRSTSHHMSLIDRGYDRDSYSTEKVGGRHSPVDTHDASDIRRQTSKSTNEQNTPSLDEKEILEEGQGFMSSLLHDIFKKPPSSKLAPRKVAPSNSKSFYYY